MADPLDPHSSLDDVDSAVRSTDGPGGPSDRGAELTRLLADASVLPAGVRVVDVGGYQALKVISRAEGEYWTTADVIDDEGSGHVEVTVARRHSAFFPPTLSDLEKRPRTTCRERHQDDGSIITECTTAASDEWFGVITQRAILLRPDGTYIDVVVKNEDSRSSGRTRATPPLDADVVLSKIMHLRP